MKKNAFTLIELIGVITILSLILVIAFPALTRVLSKNENRSYDEFISTLSIACESYVESRADEFKELSNNSMYVTLADLQSAGYLKTNIFDPINDLTFEQIKENYMKVSRENGLLTCEYVNETSSNGSYITFLDNLYQATENYVESNISNLTILHDTNSEFYISLKELEALRYINNNIINPRTGETFDEMKDKTVRVYKNSSGEVNYEYTNLENGVGSYITDSLVFQFDAIYNDGKYKQHSNSRNSFLNLIGNTNSQIIGNISWEDKTFVFDGSTYVEGLPLEGDDLTIEILFSQDKILLDSSQQLISTWDYTDTGSYGASIYTRGNSINLTIGYDNGSSYDVLGHSKILENGKLISAVVSIDKDQKISFGVNGDYQESTSYLNYNNSSSNLTIASLPSNGGEKFNGKIYTIRVYNKALSQEEMLHNYNVDTLRYIRR